MAVAEPDEALLVLDGLPAGGLAGSDLFDLLDEQGLGDGLPVGEPGTALIARMVAESGLPGDHVVAEVPPLRGQLTARRLPICAALAGCRPAHMRVLVAAHSSFSAPELNAYGSLTTTGSAARLTIVHGPARIDLGFNAGINCLGPGNRSNATVGRCLSLVTRIVGSAREGMADMAPVGQPAKYTLCFAENEEVSPWLPLSVERSIAPGVSAVTVIGISGPIEAFDAETSRTEEMLSVLAHALANSAPVLSRAGRCIGGGQPLVLLTPEWAQHFARVGLSKDDVRKKLFAAATRTVDGEQLHVAAKANDLLVVVAGGPGIKQTVIPNWNGGSMAVTTAVQ